MMEQTVGLEKWLNITALAKNDLVPKSFRLVLSYFPAHPHHVVHFSILHFPQFHLESKALAHDANTTYFSHSEWIVVTARSNSDTAVRVPSQFRWLVLRTSIHTDATNTAYHDTDLQNYSRTAIVFSSLTMLVSSQAVKHQSAHQYVFQSHSSNIFHYN